MKRHFICALTWLVFSLSLIFSSVTIAEPDTWTKKADMPTARFALSTSVVNGKIYAIGGNNGNSGFFSTVEEYDPVSDTWTKKADMPTARGALSTSVVNGKIYAIGGLKDHTGVLSTVEVYDPATNKWTKIRDMPTGRDALSTSVVNGKIYAIGGYSWNGVNWTSVSTVEEYNPMSGRWTKKTDMPTATYGLSTSAVNGKIYAIGGAGGANNTILSTVEEYDTGFAGEGVEAKDKLATKWGKIKVNK